MPESLKVLVKYDQMRKLRNSCIEILNLSNFSFDSQIMIFNKNTYILISLIEKFFFTSIGIRK